MNTNITREKNRVTVNVSLSAEEMQPHFRAAARAASASLSLKGFRPGRIPYDVVAKTVGPEKLARDVTERAIRRALADIIERESWAPIESPQANSAVAEPEKPFAFEATFDVLPDVTLPPLEGIFVEHKTPTVDETEVDRALTYLQHSRAKTVTVNRPARDGDRVEADFIIRADDAVVEDGRSTNHPVVIGSKMYVPGFEEALIGSAAGVSKTVTIAVPPDYRDRRIAGRAIDIAFTVKLVQERILPSLDDAFASSLGQFKTLQDLSDSVRAGLLREKEGEEQRRYRAELLEKVANRASVEIPSVLVDREMETMDRELEDTAASAGLDVAAYLGTVSKTRDELKNEWRPEAERRVRLALTLKALADSFDIHPDEREVAERMNVTLRRYRSNGEANGAIDEDRFFQYTYAMLRNEKTLDHLEKVAQSAAPSA